MMGKSLISGIVGEFSPVGLSIALDEFLGENASLIQ